MTECTGTTHYEGCPCHEARRDAELEAVKAKADRLAEALESFPGFTDDASIGDVWAERKANALAAYRDGE